MKRLLLLFCLISLTATAKQPESTKSSKIDGTRGGGQIMWINGTGRLVDLVDPTVCELKDGIEMRREIPELDVILNKLAAVDWYFAAGLKYEIDHLQVCLTTHLQRLSAWDWDSVHTYDPSPRGQVAIRILDTNDVYVDRRLYYDGMPRGDRPYTMIHEAMHKFIPRYASRRNASVKGAVKAVERVALGFTKSQERFRKDLNFNQVQYPVASQAMNQYRSAIEFALGDEIDQKEILIKTSNLSAIFDVNLSLISRELNYEHQKEMSRSVTEQVSEIILSAGSDLSVVQKLLDSTTIQSVDPLMLVLGSQLLVSNATYREYVLSHPRMKQGPRLYDRMGEAHLKLANSRIMATGSLPYLGVMEDSYTLQNVPALAIRYMTMAEWELIQPEVRGLIQVIGVLLQNPESNWSVVESFVTNNDGFYRGFSITPALNDMATVISPIARENVYLARFLPMLPMGFRQVLLTKTAQIAGEVAAQELDKKIDWNRLGLTNSARETKNETRK